MIGFNDPTRSDDSIMEMRILCVAEILDFVLGKDFFSRIFVPQRTVRHYPSLNIIMLSSPRESVVVP